MASGSHSRFASQNFFAVLETSDDCDEPQGKPEIKKDENVCCICLSSTPDCIVEPCKHDTFCVRCISKMIQRDKIVPCPLCRKNIAVVDVKADSMEYRDMLELADACNVYIQNAFMSILETCLRDLLDMEKQIPPDEPSDSRRRLEIRAGIENIKTSMNRLEKLILSSPI